MLKRKRITYLLSIAITIGMIPNQMVMADTSSAVIYQNDFEDSTEAEATEIAGNGVLGFIANFATTSSSWEMIFQKELGADFTEEIYSGATLSFDLILPTSADYTGLLKAQAVTKMGDSWTWTQASTISEITANDFTDLGNGYKGKTVSIPFGNEIETYQGLKAIIPSLAASDCDYVGEIFLDNVKLINGQEKQVQDVIFTEDFANTADAEQIGDFYAIKYLVTGDTSNSWMNVFQHALGSDYSNKIYSGAILSFDLLLPISATYDGSFKAQAITKMGDAWTWTQSDFIPEITEDDFTNLGNGYKLATVSIPFGAEIEVLQGLKEVIPSLAASNCTYIGHIYLSNVKLVNGISSGSVDLEKVDPIYFTFDTEDSITNWKGDGNYQYDGGLSLAHTLAVGDGAMAVTLDYSNNSTSNWSEAKVAYTFPESVDLEGYTKFTCDVIYDPSKMTGGSFKLKLSAGSIDADTNVENEEDYGVGLKKATVTINFGSSANVIGGFVLGIVGSNTNYKGIIYLDNMVFDQVSQRDSPYIEATKTIEVQTSINVNSSSITANGMTQSALSQASLVDDKAIASTAKLYAYLDAIGKTDSVLFGHQNDIHHKTGNRGLTNSDTKDVTGSISAIVGIDTLSLTGNELGAWDMTEQARVEACAAMTKEAADAGAIITLSAHMPNFEVINQRVENHNANATSQNSVGLLSDGSYNFSGYTPGTLSGDIVTRIMPGQDLNYLYTAYLDMIAEYAKLLENDDIPVLFRPFHENTGSWFWWGAAFCDKDAYKNLYKYTVEYLRDEKDVHNFIYVYSPSGDAESTVDFENRYPGDDYVDMVGFDMYHQSPALGDDFIKQFKSQLNIVETFAKEHNKLFAVTETGVANSGGNALLLKDNERKEWYSEVLEAIAPSTASYFLVWANFGLNSGYYTPFVDSLSDSKMIGHEMLDNFIDFYNDGRSVFANEVGNYKNLNVSTVTNTKVTGYITKPVSGSNVTKGIFVEASARNVASGASVVFVAKNKTGDLIETCSAALNYSGKYVGNFTDAQISALGQTIGTIALVIDNTTYNTINVKFNLTEVIKDPTLIDDFEGYYGENSLLNTTWSTGKGSGCTIKASLSTKAYEGEQGMELKYTLVSGGYVGLTTSLKSPDWSTANALQFWTIPDAKKQKIVVQLTSAGNVFEIYLNEYEAYTSVTTPLLVTIPFSSFVGRDNKSAVFDKNAVESFGLWCNAIVPQGETKESFSLDSALYYDSIKVVNIDATAVTFKVPSKPTAPGGSQPTTSGSGSGNSGGGAGSVNAEDKMLLKVNNDTPVLKNKKLKISLSALSNDLLSAVNASISKNSRLTALSNNLIFDLTFSNSDGMQEALTTPIKIVFDLGDFETDKMLSLVQFVKTKDNTFEAVLLGGEHDKENHTFTAYVFANGTYSIMHAADMLTIKLVIGDKSARLNNQIKTNDVAPFTLENRTVVPLRFIAEYLGAEVKWDNKLKQAAISLDDKTLVLNLNQSLKNGGLFIKDQRCFVPLRYISEHLDATVLWYAEENIIYIVR